MNDLQSWFLQLRNIIVGILSVFGLPLAVTVALANFSLAAIAIVLLIIYRQVLIPLLIVVIVLVALRR